MKEEEIPPRTIFYPLPISSPFDKPTKEAKGSKAELVRHPKILPSFRKRGRGRFSKYNGDEGDCSTQAV